MKLSNRLLTVSILSVLLGAQVVQAADVPVAVAVRAVRAFQSARLGAVGIGDREIQERSMSDDDPRSVRRATSIAALLRAASERHSGPTPLRRLHRDKSGI